jgi:hypothetical protein
MPLVVEARGEEMGFSGPTREARLVLGINITESLYYTSTE